MMRGSQRGVLQTVPLFFNFLGLMFVLNRLIARGLRGATKVFIQSSNHLDLDIFLNNFSCLLLQFSSYVLRLQT